ncbi:unnamed protein product [Cylindrotheca closterium]|uniref:Uncharacterized protein n=1 Tax=Cylindrotheca closterium TaxID=2856 RepID=A0AAD2G709_9STRA|nr:unnamed protein product [Cylindrotheca closterium]
MMEFESNTSTARPGTNDATIMSHKRTCDLLEDADTKKSKLDTSCDDTTIASTVAGATSLQNPGSPSENSIENADLDPDCHCRMESTVDPANAAWNHFQQSNENHDKVPNLQSYLEAKSMRENAKKQFLTSIEIYFEGLTQTMDDLLQHSVVAIHNEMEERLDSNEADVIATLKSNHNRRHIMRKQMDQANQAWVRQYSQVCNKIAPPEQASPTDESMNKTTGETTPPASSSSPPTSPANDSNLQDDNGELDWEALGDTPTNRNKIRGFLTAREQFQHAAEALSQDLDDIHAGLRAQVEAIIQVAVDVHDQDEKTCFTLEDDIQFHLMENEKRRANLQEKLEQSAMQAQGLFADLLSRLAQK